MTGTTANPKSRFKASRFKLSRSKSHRYTSRPGDPRCSRTGRPLTLFERRWYGMRRAARMRMWSDFRMLRREAAWFATYLARLVAKVWLLRAPMVPFWWCIVLHPVLSGHRLTEAAAHGFATMSASALYLLAGCALTAIYVRQDPYQSYIAMEIDAYMTDWTRRVQARMFD